MGRTCACAPTQDSRATPLPLGHPLPFYMVVPTTVLGRRPPGHPPAVRLLRSSFTCSSTFGAPWRARATLSATTPQPLRPHLAPYFSRPRDCSNTSYRLRPLPHQHRRQRQPQATRRRETSTTHLLDCFQVRTTCATPPTTPTPTTCNSYVPPRFRRET